MDKSLKELFQGYSPERHFPVLEATIEKRAQESE